MSIYFKFLEYQNIILKISSSPKKSLFLPYFFLVREGKERTIILFYIMLNFEILQFLIRLFSLENRKNNFTLQAITFYFIFFLTYVIRSFRRGTIKYSELALNSFSGLCRLSKVDLKKYNNAFLARMKILHNTNNTVFRFSKENYPEIKDNYLEDI